MEREGAKSGEAYDPTSSSWKLIQSRWVRVRARVGHVGDWLGSPWSHPGDRQWWELTDVEDETTGLAR